MEVEVYEHGVPSWVDVSCPDIEASRAFYSALFGWEIPPGDESTGGYSVAQLRGRSVAGLGPQMDPSPPHWTTYVNVDDADAIAAKVKENGGEVLMTMQVLDAGTMGLFMDPSGAAFGVWQPNVHKGAGIVNEPNSLCWNELMTADVAGAKVFYPAVFGWTAEDVGPTPAEEHGGYAEWKLGDRSIGGLMRKPDEVPAEVPNCWNTYFSVADCDASIERIKELGGSLVMGPFDIEPGRFGVVADPAGAVFNVMALKEGVGG